MTERSGGFPVRVETARLVLRRALDADIDDYCRRIYGDPAVMRTLPGGQPVPLDEARPRARSHLVAHWDEHDFGPWLVERAADRRVIGHCGLRHWPGSRDVEVLYALEPAAWGQGFTREAACASVPAAFETLHLARIIGAVIPGNHASEAILRRLGMTPSGTLDFAGLTVAMFELSAERYREETSHED